MRRLALAASALLAWATIAVAAPSSERISVFPASKAFDHLADYYRLPPAERSRFALAYSVQEKDKPVPSRLTLLDGGGETSLPATPDGWLTRLPSADALARGAQLRAAVPTDSKPGFVMTPEVILRDSAEVRVADLREASDQFLAVTRKLGPLALIIPRFNRVLFSGAEGAVAVDGQGRVSPLPAWRGTPFLDLKGPSDARTVRFSKPPHHALLSPVMK